MNALVRLIAATAITLFANGLAMAEPLTLGIAKAAVISDPVSGRESLSLKMTLDSAKLFADFTRVNIGKVVDLSIDGAVVMSPRLMEPIIGGEIMVGGTFAPGELERIAEKISSGGVSVTVDARAEQPGG
ncbi:hypothetical protein DBIPINDM_006597 [Mesorhizobium sp. AR02]|uniref:SecDF P1 head subdomain-containing protein n=1 Tax=Mesorhizobium sp. AR02 TaxID=2865837 RepID=UPI00215F2070|nr:hypothetical protein [Mesorhizobium sp. AR02]UVK53135.1 hypothetical protein DBIPINDM_006597 [Mesorhizobium sp. AR02]